MMVTITCKIPPKLNARLTDIARRRSLSKSDVVREAIERQLDGSRPRGSVRALDLLKPLCGSLRGPRDLSTNPKYLEGMGG